ncbi:hypothetical protein KTE19_10155 [Lentilactobacillus sp. IMAU92037]|uniref:hypothetical protein n=1 Tax=Lentilactobacillus dabitei TaxID=2831523 RepID=UPI001C277EAD|nr:hypothetical protein [Lentilactobacillus dabitei]MBU9790208.1 hypothetical protein [Lentilactobacillus dabitei]MBV0931051.1 hypothetical protein [Lentilactobacillus dabitei]
MSVDELFMKIKDYQDKLKLPDDYLFNIVEFTPAEVAEYNQKKAAPGIYESVLKQIQRLYLLSLTPAELLAKLRAIKASAHLSEAAWLKGMAVSEVDVADFLAGKKPTMVYVTALNALKAKYPVE